TRKPAPATSIGTCLLRQLLDDGGVGLCGRGPVYETFCSRERRSRGSGRVTAVRRGRSGRWPRNGSDNRKALTGDPKAKPVQGRARGDEGLGSSYLPGRHKFQYPQSVSSAPTMVVNCGYITTRR